MHNETFSYTYTMIWGHLAGFTARCLCTARTMPWQDVCPSVRPSVHHMPIFCLNS